MWFNQSACGSVAAGPAGNSRGRRRMESGCLQCGGTAALQQCRKNDPAELSPILQAQGLHAACTALHARHMRAEAAPQPCHRRLPNCTAGVLASA